jgi:hypothetical protein
MRTERRDRRRPREPLPAEDDEPRLWFADIYHGGVTFWDWIVLRGGGLWWSVLWPLVIGTSLERLRRHPEARAVLELDARARRPRRRSLAVSAPIGTLRRRSDRGQHLRAASHTDGRRRRTSRFLLHLRIRASSAPRIVVLAGELIRPQLPQILASSGIENLVLRTHWAPFGTDPEADADLVRWRGPDGSEVRTVPRYSFMDYRLQQAGHPGVQNAGLTGDDFERWTDEDKDRFAEQARRRGVERPFVTRLADPKPPESPFPGVLAAARRRGSRMVTVREYFALPHPEGPRVHYGIDDIPTTLPGGRAGEQLHREQTAASALLMRSGSTRSSGRWALLGSRRGSTRRGSC